MRNLTPHISLESLKKEAKAWLRALRAGDPAARRRLTAILPGESAEPGLRQVQHALAREFGLPGWTDLKDALEGLTLALRSHAELADLLLRSAKPWDSDKPGAARIFARVRERMPGLARHSLHAAAMFGDLDAVNGHLAREPDAARRKGGPLDWEPILYLAYGRLPGSETQAVEIATLLFDHGANPAARMMDDWDNPFTLLNGVIGHGEQGRSEHPLAESLADLFIARGTDPFATQVLYDTSVDTDDTRWLDYLWRQCAAHGGTERWHRHHHGLGPQTGNTLDYLLGNAVSYNHLCRAAWLMAHGADPDGKSAYSRRSHHEEAQLAGFAEMAALLERHGATPVILTGGGAFIAAAMRRDFTAARAMAARSPALLRDSMALIVAAQRGFSDVAAMLLELGVPVDGDHGGKGALHWAAQNGHVDVARILIAGGAQIDKREHSYNGTPLGFARHFGQLEMVAALAPFSRDLFNLVQSNCLDRLDEILRDEPSLVHGRNREGDPLICVLPDDDEAAVEAAEFLLRHGADPQARSGKRESAAQIARNRGLTDAADIIEAAGG